MYDEMMDLGDMYPEIGDLYDNAMPFMSNLFGGQGSTGGAGGASSGYFPFLDGYGDLNDMMSDVVDNLKDGDLQDVMQNLMSMAQMGLPGLDINSIMQGGMPNLNGIMQGLAPYLAMDGDFYGDFGDLYNFGSDLFEDYYKYGMGMGGMGMGGAQGQGQGMGGLDINSIMAMMTGTRLQKARLAKKLRQRKHNRLLKKTHTNRKLRKPREFPWYMFQNQQQQQGSGQTQSRFTWPFMFDAPDAEDVQNFLMMGGNRNQIPPPVDGIDTEDLWMYRGTQYDPMRLIRGLTGQSSTDSTASTTQTGMNPWLYAFFSGLQKARMQKKF